MEQSTREGSQGGGGCVLLTSFLHHFDSLCYIADSGTSANGCPSFIGSSNNRGRKVPNRLGQDSKGESKAESTIKAPKWAKSPKYQNSPYPCPQRPQKCSSSTAAARVRTLQTHTPLQFPASLCSWIVPTGLRPTNETWAEVVCVTPGQGRYKGQSASSISPFPCGAISDVSATRGSRAI